jgi:hypothetical protein
VHFGIVAHHLGSTEVDDFNGTVVCCINQNVLGLEVSVANFLVMAISHRLQNLFRHYCCFFFVELLAAGNLFEKFLALT